MWPLPMQGSIKTQSLIQARSLEKCIKTAKTAGNKAFLAVFAAVVAIQLASPAAIRGAADAVVGAPGQRAQGKIKRYAKIKKCKETKWFYAWKTFTRALNIASTSSPVFAFPSEIRIVPLA